MTVEGYIRIILAVIVLVVMLVILFRFRGGKNTRRKGSLEIMRKRYEKGEITKEEYENAKERQGKH
ncbi:SHOCT domain-containing protein [Lentibacillus juripiscarius]|uniref:SHOCT domain-containing protein n=1 Tax=Lentibacillus juripiscarius TaxID=257446 RepID=A0ABW5V5B5_9BACI